MTLAKFCRKALRTLALILSVALSDPRRASNIPELLSTGVHSYSE